MGCIVWRLITRGTVSLRPGPRCACNMRANDLIVMLKPLPCVRCDLPRSWSLTKPYVTCVCVYGSRKAMHLHFVVSISLKYLSFINQLHAVSRSRQGRQKEPSVKTLRFPISAEFWGYCVLSGGTQLRALPLHQSEENKKSPF